MASLETTMSVDSHTTDSTRSLSPLDAPPSAFPGQATWDGFPPPAPGTPEAAHELEALVAPDELPEYARVDPERMRRESISQALWAEHRQRQAEMARAFDADRLERRASREAQRRGSGVFARWIRWSARFYMPLMSQWGDRHAR